MSKAQSASIVNRLGSEADQVKAERGDNSPAGKAASAIETWAEAIYTGDKPSDPMIAAPVEKARQACRESGG